jgi:hypothetical protein
VTDPSVAEAIAAKLGVEFCREMAFQNIVMEGDAQELVNAMGNPVLSSSDVIDFLFMDSKSRAE